MASRAGIRDAFWRHAEASSAVVAIVAAVRTTAFDLREGFPLDDAWIHMVYGRALATTGTFDYDDGVPGTGATSPLWAVVAALAHLISGPDNAFGTAFLLKLAGIGAHAAASYLAGRLARALTDGSPVAALVASMLVATAPRLGFAAPSGMEVALASALVLGTFLAAVRGKVLVTGTLAGLAILARPEAIVVAPLALGLVRSHGGGRRWGAAIACGAVFPAAWAIRNQISVGQALPSTIRMKSFSLHGAERIEGIWTVFVDLLGSAAPMTGLVLVVLALAAIALCAKDRSRRPAALVGTAGLAWLLGLALTTRFVQTKGFYFERYLLPAFPLVVVAAIRAVQLLVARATSHRHALSALGLALIIVHVVGWSGARADYRRDVVAIDGVQVAVGHFVAANLRPDAVVWSSDAGAIRYFGRRRVLDIGGLNTAAILREPLAIPRAWAADAILLQIPYGFRAFPDGVDPWIVFEAPVNWRTLPPPPSAEGPMPVQAIALCPPRFEGDVTVTRAGRRLFRGPCRGAPVAP